jgi:hypothetical protein
MIKERNGERTIPHGAESPLSVHWDDSNMRSLYANVCNVTGTRAEVVLLFGVNQAWQPGVKELTVQLQDRIILSPYAAKRLAFLLGRVLREYESRYGALSLETPGPIGPGDKLPAAEAAASIG